MLAGSIRFIIRAGRIRRVALPINVIRVVANVVVVSAFGFSTTLHFSKSLNYTA